MTSHHSSSSSNGRQILIQELTNLLGFDDGASDVLDLLLTIESSEDLLDYLSQLLGSSNEKKLKQLVEDMSRFQKGETISSSNSDDDPNDKKKPAVSKPAEPTYETTTIATAGKKKKGLEMNKTQMTPRQKQQQTIANKNKKTSPYRPKQTFRSKVGGSGVPQQQQQQQTKKQPPRTSSERVTAVNTNNQGTTPNNDSFTTFSETTTTTTRAKSHPPRGQTKFVCGCFGTFHKALTNCLFCGRISCVKEGYDYCPFCGYLVERVVGSGSATSAASRHKERLLRFDREYAKRTVVLDDQADYFTHQSLNWMGTEDDRQSALTKEQERLEQAGSHAYMKLELSV